MQYNGNATTAAKNNPILEEELYLLMTFLACEQQEPAYTIPNANSSTPRASELASTVKTPTTKETAGDPAEAIPPSPVANSNRVSEAEAGDPAVVVPSNCSQIAGAKLEGELIPMQVTVSGGGSGALMIELSQSSEILMKLDCGENRVAKFNVSVDWLRLTFTAAIGTESGSYNDITPSLEDNAVEIEIGRDTLEPWFGPDGVDDPGAEPALPPSDAPPPPPPPPENEPPNPVNERTPPPSDD